MSIGFIQIVKLISVIQIISGKAISHIKNNNPREFLAIVGDRETGKTVKLETIYKKALSEKYKVLILDPVIQHPKKSLSFRLDIPSHNSSVKSDVIKSISENIKFSSYDDLCYLINDYRDKSPILYKLLDDFHKRRDVHSISVDLSTYVERSWETKNINKRKFLRGIYRREIYITLLFAVGLLRKRNAYYLLIDEPELSNRCTNLFKYWLSLDNKIAITSHDFLSLKSIKSHVSKWITL